MRSLGADYDVDTLGSQRENHHNKSHSRFGSSCLHPFDRILSKLIYFVFWQTSVQWCHVFYLIPFLTCHIFLSSPEPIFRLAFENPEASNYHQNPREVSSTHSSPYKTLPRPPREPHSMPPTPVMTRNAYSSSHLRSDLQFSALSLRSLLVCLRVLHRWWQWHRPVQDSNSRLHSNLLPPLQ